MRTAPSHLGFDPLNRGGDCIHILLLLGYLDGVDNAAASASYSDEPRTIRVIRQRSAIKSYCHQGAVRNDVHTAYPAKKPRESFGAGLTVGVLPGNASCMKSDDPISFRLLRTTLLIVSKAMQTSRSASPLGVQQLPPAGLPTHPRLAFRYHFPKVPIDLQTSVSCSLNGCPRSTKREFSLPNVGCSAIGSRC